MELFEVGEALSGCLKAWFLAINGFAQELLGAYLSGRWCLISHPWRAS